MSLCTTEPKLTHLGRQIITPIFYMPVCESEKHVPYFLDDYIRIDEKDLHAYPIETQKFALGYKHEFTTYINLKSQFEYSKSRLPHGAHSHDMDDNFSFRLQLAYGF
jgi:hypothetical protein